MLVIYLSRDLIEITNYKGIYANTTKIYKNYIHGVYQI